MSTALLATTIAMSSLAVSNSGHGGGCPISDYGFICLGFFGAFLLAAVLSILAAACSDYMGKWCDRFLGASVFFLVASLVPVIIGMIHDCR